MRGPSLCFCCCCAVLSLCVCVPVLPRRFSTQKKQAKKHQYHSSILQWESPNAKYSSVGKITAKLWQSQWFIYSRVQAVREMKGACVCAWACVDALFHLRCGAWKQTTWKYKHLRSKICTDLFSSRGFKGIFLGALMCMWEKVGTAVMRGGKVREIKRVPFKKKSPAPSYKLNDLQALAFSLSSEYWYTQTYDAGPFLSRNQRSVKWDLAILWKCLQFLLNV